MSADSSDAGPRLNQLLAAAGLPPLDAPLVARFAEYLALLLRWNARMNLTSVRDPDQILTRHFVESIACARALPPEISTLLDFGSGAGFPGFPIALCRPEMAVTLAESHAKKAAFLREAVRVLGISAEVHSGRAEALSRRFDCVALRAVDKMPAAVSLGARLVDANGWLALMTTESDQGDLKVTAGPGFLWSPSALLPGGENRVLLLGRQGSGALQGSN